MIAILFSFRSSKMDQCTGKFEVLPIPSTLRGIIKSSWRITIGQHPIKILPDGMLHFYLFPQKTNALYLKTANKTCKTSFVKGLSQEIYSIQGARGVTFILCTIYPWIGTTIFDTAMSRLVDKQLTFPSLGANSLCHKAFFQHILLPRYYSFEKQAIEQNKVIKKAYFQIMKNEGDRTVAKIALRAFLSESSLRKKFYQYVGLSPKNLAKVSRNFSVVKALHHDFKGNLTGLAYQFGYYDQAHFIREFRQVMRATPRQYLADTTNLFIPYQVRQNAFLPTFST